MGIWTVDPVKIARDHFIPCTDRETSISCTVTVCLDLVVPDQGALRLSNTFASKASKVACALVVAVDCSF